MYGTVGYHRHNHSASEDGFNLGAYLHAHTLPNPKCNFPGQHGGSSRQGEYQSIFYPAVLPLCKIGYFPMIEVSRTELTPVYTVLKHAQMVSDLLEQHDAEITFDLAIFINAKQTQIKFHEDFSNTVPCFGG